MLTEVRACLLVIGQTFYTKPYRVLYCKPYTECCVAGWPGCGCLKHWIPRVNSGRKMKRGMGCKHVCWSARTDVNASCCFMLTDVPLRPSPPRPPRSPPSKSGAAILPEGGAASRGERIRPRRDNKIEYRRTSNAFSFYFCFVR